MKNTIKKLILIVLLVLFNLTVSLGQVGNENTICYTHKELIKIANVSTEVKKLREVYKIAEQQLAFKDSALYYKTQSLFAKDLVIANKDTALFLKEHIIIGKDNEITELRNVIATTNRKLKWGKIKFAGTTVALSGAALFLLLR